MGFWELLLILLVVLLFFGAGKLGGLGAGRGKAPRGFKDAIGGGTAGPGAQPPRD